MKILPALVCLTALGLLGACATSTQPPAAAPLLMASDLRAHSDALAVALQTDNPAQPSPQFGDYTTHHLEARWSRERDFMVVNPTQLTQARQKFSFTQQGPQEQRAEVLGMTILRNASFHWVNGAFTSDFNQSNSFAGSITPLRPNTPAPTFKSLSGILNYGEFAWEFIVYNPDGNEGSALESGMIQDIRGNQILIRALRQFENQPPSPRNLGFEFLQNDVHIGAVSLLPSPQVWLRRDLSPDLKLVLSSLSSALLIRRSMQTATPH
ncbi:MAG: hypothetical protein AB3X41_01335 [Leptothrix ochracea]|uniref:hypothetical protein n=1 Tax=Leptothrix ochracea TaxID=735331 RepID=UPI0034E1AB71